MGSDARQENKAAGIDDKLSALLSNAAAVRALAFSIESTLGPKGLDCMLVDRFGEVTVTNDGSTILDKVETNHPVARMLIRAAKAQDAQVGDGTTTATLLASTLIGCGVERILKGVPVAKVLEGISLGIEKAIEVIRAAVRPVAGVNDPLVWQAAYIAGRESVELANLVLKAVNLLGEDRLLDPAFKLASTIVAIDGADSEVFPGLIIERSRMNHMMPRSVESPLVLVMDDALEPEQLEDEALTTELGFTRHLELQEDFKRNVRKLVDLGVRLAVVQKSVSDVAEELLADAGVMVIRRVSPRDLAAVVEHTGAKSIKRASLRKPVQELAQFLGRCERAYEDEKLGHICIIGGVGCSSATVVIGAATREVKEELERIAEDAASSVQAVIMGGVVPGGGAVEIAAAREVAELKDGIRGMASYGAECVIEALKRPLWQIVANAGFNPLEKVEDVIAAQSACDSASLGINCDTGEVVDMYELGVVDPARVKIHALKTGAEVARAVLRINTIIKRRDGNVADLSERDVGGTHESSV